MSGYGSRAQAQAVVRATIESGGNGTMPSDLPRDLSAYRMAQIYEATVHSRGVGYGWGIEVDGDRFWMAVRASLRVTEPRSGDLCSYGKAPTPAHYVTHYHCDDYADGTVVDARNGRLNAEVLNALGSEGVYVTFGTIYDIVRQVPDLADVTRPEVQKALVGMMHSDGIWTELLPGRGWRKAVTPDPEPVAGLETDQMGQGILENRALDIFREIAASGEAGGPALVRLASDLETMIRAASFPQLTATVTPDEDSEADEFGNLPTIIKIGCPVCGDDDVIPSTLYAVDAAERWATVNEFEVAFDPAPGQPVGFVNVSGSSTDFDGVGYYLHANGTPHSVSLPENWTEAAL